MTKKMTQDEIAAKANASAITRTENAALAERAAAAATASAATIAYDNACDDPTPLPNAFATIAAFFYDPGMVWDRDERCEVPGNQLAYTQRDVLNGLCWVLSTKIEKVSDNLDKAKAKVRREASTQDGSEIAMVNLDKAISWAERMNLQLASVEDAYNAAAAMHEAATGHVFVRPARRVTGDSPTVDQSAQASRLAALGIAVPASSTVETQTNGVAQSEAEAPA